MTGKEVIDGSAQVWNHLRQDLIGLENVVIKDKTSHGQYVLAVIGKVRVANLFYEKFMFARVTFDAWATYQDYKGAYMESSDDGSNDTFSFGFTRRDRCAVDVEFAVCCVQGGRYMWDNNDGKNYKFHLKKNPFKQ